MMQLIVHQAPRESINISDYMSEFVAKDKNGNARFEARKQNEKNFLRFYNLT